MPEPGSATDAHPKAARARSPFAPFKVRRIYEVIVDLIKERVFSGEYRPGERLPAERDLAHALGVGRLAVREAYRALELIGIVEIRKGNKGGAFITARDHRTVTETLNDLIRLRQITMHELTQARLVLEKDVAEFAIRRVTLADLARLRACAEGAIAQSRQGLTATEANLRFHVLLGELSGNRVLALMLASTMDLLRLFIQAARPGPGVSLDNATEHLQIVDALRGGDFTVLWPLLEEHILKSNGALVELAKRSPGFASPAPARDARARLPASGTSRLPRPGPAMEDPSR